MSIKIVFFDMDGTLASNEDHSVGFFARIPNSAKEGIRMLKERGINVAIATGRSYDNMKPLASALGIDTFICSNGSLVVHHDEILDITTIPHDLAINAIESLKNIPGINVYIETATGDYRVGDAQSDLSFMGDNIKQISGIDAVKAYDVFQVVGNGIDIAQHVKDLDQRLTIKKFGPHAFNISLNGINKGVALQHVLGKLDLDPSEAMAFGDEENDIEMFTNVKTSVAMGESNASLRTLATYVTTSVEDDGVLNALKYFGLVD